MQRKLVLFSLIVLAAIFLTAQSCGNFVLQQPSSTTLQCEYTGQLFCGDDSKTRVCSFINGAPHLEYDGQDCNTETGELVNSGLAAVTEPTTAIPSASNEPTATTEPFTVTIEPAATTVQNVAEAEPSSSQDTITVVNTNAQATSSQLSAVDQLNVYCTGKSVGFYCDARTLVYCQNDLVQNYFPCVDSSACDTAKTAADPNLCFAPFCASKATGSYCYSTGMVITCDKSFNLQDDLQICTADCQGTSGTATCGSSASSTVSVNTLNTLGAVSDFCDNKESGDYCESASVVTSCDGYDIAVTKTCKLQERCLSVSGSVGCMAQAIIDPLCQNQPTFQLFCTTNGFIGSCEEDGLGNVDFALKTDCTGDGGCAFDTTAGNFACVRADSKFS